MSVDYHGRPTLRIESPHLWIDVLAAAGPRIVRVILKPDARVPTSSHSGPAAGSSGSSSGSGENQFAEVPSVGWDTPYGRYDLLGGHRLWHSPEAFPGSYIPDDSGIEIEELPAGGLRLTGVPEEATGIQKVMEVIPHAGGPRVTVHHVLRNAGLWPVEAAPWPITQLPLGGVGIFPMLAPGPSPYSPNRHIQLWRYSRLDDPRLELHDDLVLLHARRRRAADASGRDGDDSDVGAAFKFGCFNHAGWAGYLRGDLLFVKRFEVRSSARHSDNGCNVESYLDNRFIELETLGPLERIEPGEEIRHAEEWQWYDGSKAAPTFQGIGELIARLALPADPITGTAS